MTDEERRLKTFTRRNLKKLANWDAWSDAFNQQLNDHDKAGVFGEPTKKSELPKEQQSQICRFQWSNLIKANGKRKC